MNGNYRWERKLCLSSHIMAYLNMVNDLYRAERTTLFLVAENMIKLAKNFNTQTQRYMGMCRTLPGIPNLWNFLRSSDSMWLCR